MANQNHRYVRRVAISAMCVAGSVVLCRLLGFSPGGTALRVEIGFLPILLVAHLYGPLWSGMAYLLADLLGALVTTGVDPFIMLAKASVGVCMGLFFYRRSLSLVRSAVGFTVIAVTIEFFVMTLIFRFPFGMPWETAFIQRAITAFGNLPIRILLSYLLGTILKGTRGKIFYE